ncbi:MAG: MMPL family transporter, partial [Candidatus Thermoplasmatota archaeon]|nr:MMPL family transporter [Candidatus Thermoplasmatota archaeon]
MSESSSLKEGPLDIVKEKYQTAKRAVSEKSMQSLDNMYSNVLTSPATVVILLIIISAFFAQQGMDFQSQIDDDVEIFLPDGAPSTDLLLEVREEWSTDITVIYIRTENAFDMSSDANITDKAILDVISWVEGDDNNVDGDSISRGIDYDKDDHGENDGVLWIISPAQVIKEINSADGRFNNSMCEHGVATRILLVDEEWCSNLPGGGEYAIPEQERIDTIIEQSNGSFDTLIKDTNNDGIWDTTAIIVGMNQNFEVIDDFNNFEELLAHFERVVDNRPESEITVMTVTGLTKVLEDISDAIYEDLLMILPWSILFTVLIITTLHRSLKVVAITGTPIVMALAFTFGSSVILDITLTPMIVATFPILIGLGVDYALHMVNRIEEVRRKELQRMQEENIRRKKRGEKELKVPDLWDMDFYKKCVLEMASSTGVAVFLSAVTTVIGFSVL